MEEQDWRAEYKEEFTKGRHIHRILIYEQWHFIILFKQGLHRELMRNEDSFER
jgi:hypothetical protein